VTIASHHHTGSTPPDDRAWILVIATTGWVVLTAVAVMLATGAMAGSASVGEPGPPTERMPVPQQRAPLRPTHQPTDRPPTARADREGLVHPGAALALIPRQRPDR
jgi:hypothetical protein